MAQAKKKPAAKPKAAATAKAKSKPPKAAPKPTAKPTKPTKPTKATAAKATKAPPALEARPPEQAQFLASILANADDKKARLVYADLLQEAGDPRGEFIIHQCARADIPDDDARCADLDASIDALHKKHKKTWVAALGDNKGARYEYRRGFVEKLSLDATDLLANAAKIFAAEPIEELNVWKIDESKTKLGKSRLAPILALPIERIRRLSLARCALTTDDFTALATAKSLGSVELLDLTNGGSNEIDLEPLAKATSLPKLRELKITGCMIGTAQLAILAASKTLRFTRLHAARNELRDAAGEAIANATWAPQLEYLDVSSNEGFGLVGVQALAASKTLVALRTFKATYCGLYEDACADAILDSPVFANLELLDIASNMSRENYDRLKQKFGDRLV